MRRGGRRNACDGGFGVAPEQGMVLTERRAPEESHDRYLLEEEQVRWNLG
jgi:hypothetical protein